MNDMIHVTVDRFVNSLNIRIRSICKRRNSSRLSPRKVNIRRSSHGAGGRRRTMLNTSHVKVRCTFSIVSMSHLLHGFYIGVQYSRMGLT